MNASDAHQADVVSELHALTAKYDTANKAHVVQVRGWRPS